MKALNSIRQHLFLALIIGFVLVGVIGVWGANSEFAGAVIAQGQLVVDSSVKKVQHPTGGVIAELNVKEGDKVKAGEIIVKLDDTQTRANLQIVSKGLDEPQSKDFFEKNSFERVTDSPAEFAKLVEHDSQHWDALIKQVGAKVD